MAAGGRSAIPSATDSCFCRWRLPEGTEALALAFATLQNVVSSTVAAGNGQLQAWIDGGLTAAGQLASDSKQPSASAGSRDLPATDTAEDTSDTLTHRVGEGVVTVATVPVPRGRPPSWIEDPVTPVQQVAWLARLLRLTSVDTRVHSAGGFSERAGERGLAVSADTVGKLERGQKPFSIAWCRTYEQVLGLPVGVLADVYCYVLRTHALRPSWGDSYEEDIAPARLSLLRRLYVCGRLTPWEWLLFSRGDWTRRAVEPPVAEELARAFYAELAVSFERSERLLLEASVGLRPLLSPLLVDALSDNLDSTYNIVETLAYEPDEATETHLTDLRGFIEHEFVAQCYLDTRVRLARAINSTHQTLSLRSSLAEYAVESLRDERAFFCVREESVALLDRASQGAPRPLPPAVERLMAEARVDLVAAHTPRTKRAAATVLRISLERAQERARNRGAPVSAPQGLHGILCRALLSPGRRERLALAILMAPWPGASLVVDAVLISLTDPALRVTPGYRRACIRLITKLEAHNSGAALVKIAGMPLDEGSRSILAFGLGGVPGIDGRRALSAIHIDGASPSTTRNFKIAARRHEGAAEYR